MIRAAVTISLVPEARGGPFVFWDGLAQGCEAAASLGFDAVELFVPAATVIESKALRSTLDAHGLELAAVGTGAGWLLHQHSLSTSDQVRRDQARDFVRQIIDFAGQFQAPAIIGSMQGSAEGAKDEARQRLRDSVHTLGQYAEQYTVPLLIEPLNRYETDVINTIADGLNLLEGVSNVKLLADLFHMNIEEVDLGKAIEAAGPSIGHVHFVDSNRQAVGRGHLDVAPVVKSLLNIGYDRYLSAEVLPVPDSRSAAKQTIDSFRKHFR
ncbi:MAG: sugar phosphate isomerase/epimerase family protein [Planctomycetota bacterium]